MRYKQFKILEQEVAPNGDVSLLTPAQQLNFIKDNVMTLSDDLKQKVLDALQKLKSYVKQEPLQQNEGIDDAVALINNEIMQEISNLDQIAEEHLELITKIVQAGTSKSMQAGHTELNKIKTRIEALYTPLASKIVNGCDAFISKEEIVTDADSDELSDELSAKKQKRAELSKTGLAVRQAIADMTNGVMEKAGRLEAIKDAESELTRIEEFLKRCVEDPFINFDELIKRTHGTVEQEFSKKGSKYIDIYNQFENILGRTIDQSGAGAWGPAELGLLMLSNPVKKGTKGDIETAGGKQVEVKASKKAAAGARLNVEQALKGNLVRDYNSVLQKYFGSTIKTEEGDITVDHQTDKGQVNFTKKGFDILNSWISTLPKWNRQTAIKFLIDSVNLPMANYVGQRSYDKMLSSAMANVVNNQGQFDFANFQKAYTEVLFAVYKSEMLDCILVINPILGTFLIMNDPEDLGDTVNRGLVISGGIDFKDKQSTKSPQIGVGTLTA